MATARLLCWTAIEGAVETLFSPHSVLRARVIAACGREHNFMLREFISGALIANVVTRAKRRALTREVQGLATSPGLTADDLLGAIRDEVQREQGPVHRKQAGGHRYLLRGLQAAARLGRRVRDRADARPGGARSVERRAQATVRARPRAPPFDGGVRSR